MSIITKNDAISLLNRALEVKSPDHVQSACYYLTVPDSRGSGGYADGSRPWSRFSDAETDPQPGCLVGTALYLHDKDALVATVTENGFNGEVITNHEFLHALESNGVEIENEALHIFDVAQKVQDGRWTTSANAPWGEAVKTALTQED